MIKRDILCGETTLFDFWTRKVTCGSTPVTEDTTIKLILPYTRADLLKARTTGQLDIRYIKGLGLRSRGIGLGFVGLKSFGG